MACARNPIPCVIGSPCPDSMPRSCLLKARPNLPIVLALAASLALVASQAQASTGDSLLTSGSPASPFPNNRQNEVALAIDPLNPAVVVAGVNDTIDEGPCSVPGDDLECPFTNGVGLSGVYFSFDGGSTWTQPTYTGYSDRSGTLGVGP